MFPLYDENPTQRQAVVVPLLILACVGIFFYQLATGDAQPIRQFGMIPAVLFANPGREWGRLLGSQFLHGNLVHLFSNMWFLWIFGNNVEDRLGSGRFLGFYLACGAIAALAQGLAAPQSNIPLIGASGAIAGVMGAYAVCFPRARIVTAVFLLIFFTLVRIPAIVYLGLWIVFEIVRASQANPGLPGVAYLAHVGGFGAGLVLWWAMGGNREIDR
ncbi:MAG TPA: rhomboid family intramembrane serine protease [Cyanobacteria bacterium UBA8156]|nr:rhomboid family intramembrane serine protease [Cyanobacteria bacterium UBA8156]